MKRALATILVLCLLTLGAVGCGSDRIVHQKVCPTYGLFNQDKRCPDAAYKVIGGNVFWGILLCETIVAPIYFFGFDLYEPIP